MTNRLCKFLSILLVLVMIINMVPANAFEIELEETKPETAPAQEALSESSEVYILDELTERRTEFTKEFRLSNGLRLATVYDNAVHYQEDGQWKEIDNTLRFTQTRSGNFYVNTAGVWQTSFPQSMTENSGVTVSKDGHVLSFRMVGELLDPQHENETDEFDIVEIPVPVEPVVERADALSVEETASNTSVQLQEKGVGQDTISNTKFTAVEQAVLSAPKKKHLQQLNLLIRKKLKHRLNFPKR